MAATYADISRLDAILKDRPILDRIQDVLNKAAFVIVGLQNELADKVGPWVQVIMGIIFVVCVLAFRRGIVGELQALFRTRRG